LKIYSQILNVPFAVIKKKGDWALIQDKLKQLGHILIDAPGFNLRGPEEVQWIEDRLPPTTEGGRAVHYVQSVLAKDEDAFEIAERYRALQFQDTIITNLDESTRHGLIYNFQKNFGTPLHSFGIGPQMPEDFEAATKERVVDLIFKISKLKKGKV
jgi:flagellar biosynthesis protein FlhF